ncbi:hypothetical protein GCM10007175_38580 [Pseudarthrobacter scleromae]|uniref:Uncharacterized protein n=1 Tax=Pseudarthrobacter scleromae TaxID=158897 RepID=A0ABQ2CND1_9MICC|nr:hypothetical protein GCM10007175_38580 [Pseudarthrobacter scleromae]
MTEYCPSRFEVSIPLLIGSGLLGNKLVTYYPSGEQSEEEAVELPGGTYGGSGATDRDGVRRERDGDARW